jgi:LmbE family N-acetylglucosaminyl deacetylase
MKILVVEPHLDDAFFSLTETALTWVEDGHEVLLLTVFGGVPPEGSEHHVKYVALWQEYEAAIERGPFQHYRALDYFDDAARVGQLIWPDFIECVAAAMFGALPEIIVYPTGIHHPDHLLVRQALNDATSWLKNAWIYDELPYYVTYPEESFMAESPGALRYEREGSRGHLAEKQRICRLFGSQIGESVERCIYAPERVWRPL